MTPEGERLDRFLTGAIGDLKSGEKEPSMSRGLLRLQNLVAGFTSEIDTAADAAATEIQTKRDRCLGAVTKMKTQVGKIFDDAAKGAEDMLNQMSNGGPLEESSDSKKLPDVKVEGGAETKSGDA